MRWKGRRESTNVEDRRGMSGGGKLALGGGLGSLILLVIVVLMGGDPSMLLNSGGGGSSAGSGQQPAPAVDDEQSQFVKVVLGDTEDVWNQLFAAQGQTYEEPQLVLFTGQTPSACGMGQAAMGPFYCPGDNKVYIDLSFYRELRDRYGADGDFAQAYVIAHEVGHHIQNLLGISGKVHQARNKLSEADANEMSTRLELQADYLAGVWTHHAQRMKNMLEQGDIEEALRAANAIGDDALQKKARGFAIPDSFTHGTSEQRMRWFKKGLETGDARGIFPGEGGPGDTFSMDENRL